MEDANEEQAKIEDVGEDEDADTDANGARSVTEQKLKVRALLLLRGISQLNFYVWDCILGCLIR